MAIQLGELYGQIKLSCGHIWDSEVYYHKAICYMQFRSRYRSLQ